MNRTSTTSITHATLAALNVPRAHRAELLEICSRLRWDAAGLARVLVFVNGDAGEISTMFSHLTVAATVTRLRRLTPKSRARELAGIRRRAPDACKAIERALVRVAA